MLSPFPHEHRQLKFLVNMERILVQFLLEELRAEAQSSSAISRIECTIARAESADTDGHWSDALTCYHDAWLLVAEALEGWGAGEPPVPGATHLRAHINADSCSFSRAAWA